MAIHIENVRDSLYRQTSLSDITLQYENGGKFTLTAAQKEIRHRLSPISKALQIVIKWDFPYDNDRLGGAHIAIEANGVILSHTVWALTDRVSPHKLALAAKRLMNEFASNLTDLAKRPKGK